MDIINFLRAKRLLLPALATLPALVSAQKGERPNIMVIMVDDMGYSDPECFGGEVHTPNLNGLADEGMRFTQFFNCGRSCPSRGALLTGLYAQQCGITGMGVSLNRECVTIPEVLKEAGYNTAMSGKWHLSLTRGIGNRDDQMKWLSHQDYFDNRPFAPVETYPCNRGFDEHWGTIWGVVDHFDPFSLVHNEEPIFTDGIPDDFYSSDFVTQKSLDLLDDLTQKDEPFFMYVAYNAPHWPLHAKPEDIAKYKGVYDDGWDVMRERRYKNMIDLGLITPEQVPVAPNASGRVWENEPDKAFQSANMEVHAAMVDRVDQGIGLILDKLKATGAYDNTLIIFSSDNGASSENYEIGDFDRHDRIRDGRMVTHNSRTPGDQLSYNYLGTGWAGAVNAPFRYWKIESFHGGIAAPTIVVWPAGMKKENKGKIVNNPCHFLDLMPTCLDLAGADYPQQYKGHDITPLPAESRSFAPLLTGEGEWGGERTIFWEHESGRAVRVGDWKLTALRGQGWQLFNLANDYSETCNLSAEYPDKVRELKMLWNEWAKKVGLSVADEIPDTEKELVFYFPFDGNLEDAGERKLPLTPSGKYSFADGVYGQAVNLNGNGQYFDLLVPNLISTNNTQFTVCAWVYDDASAIPSSGASENGFFFRDEVILSQRDNNGTGRIVLYTRVENPIGGGDVRYFYNNFLGNRQNPGSDGAFKRGRWQHVAVVCNPVDRCVTYYVDGVRDRTVSTQAFEPCVGGFRIGGHKAGKDYWCGKIDELYFFRGLLSGDEIRAVRDNKYFEDSSVAVPSIPAPGIFFDNESCTLRTIDGEAVDHLAVYDVNGRQMARIRNSNHIALGTLQKGTYVAIAAHDGGESATLKFSL